jgi:hypothetical protein
LTSDEIEQLTNKVYTAVKSIPGVDKEFIKKCLQGIASLGDPTIEQKIKQLARLF